MFRHSRLKVNRVQFHQHFVSSFYTCRSWKRQKDSQVKQLFALLGSASIKAAHKHDDEIDPIWWNQKTKLSKYVKIQSYFHLLLHSSGLFTLELPNFPPEAFLRRQEIEFLTILKSKPKIGITSILPAPNSRMQSYKKLFCLKKTQLGMIFLTACRVHLNHCILYNMNWIYEPTRNFGRIYLLFLWRQIYFVALVPDYLFHFEPSI